MLERLALGPRAVSFLPSGDGLDPPELFARGTVLAVVGTLFGTAGFAFLLVVLDFA